MARDHNLVGTVRVGPGDRLQKKSRYQEIQSNKDQIDSTMIKKQRGTTLSKDGHDRLLSSVGVDILLRFKPSRTKMAISSTETTHHIQKAGRDAVDISEADTNARVGRLYSNETLLGNPVGPYSYRCRNGKRSLLICSYNRLFLASTSSRLSNPRYATWRSPLRVSIERWLKNFLSTINDVMSIRRRYY